MYMYIYMYICIYIYIYTLAGPSHHSSLAQSMFLCGWCFGVVYVWGSFENVTCLHIWYFHAINVMAGLMFENSSRYNKFYKVLYRKVYIWDFHTERLENTQSQSFNSNNVKTIYHSIAFVMGFKADIANSNISIIYCNTIDNLVSHLLWLVIFIKLNLRYKFMQAEGGFILCFVGFN